MFANRHFINLRLLTLGLALLAGTSMATIHQPGVALENQRTSYKEALILLQKGQRKSFENKIAHLKTYPLYPYLEYAETLRYISQYDNKDIQAFITQHQDSPLAERLHRHWLQTLARHKKWKEYLQAYTPGPGEKYECYFHWAQYKVGDRQLALEGAKKMWLVGKSQDRACDPLFEVWKTTGQLTPELAWCRAQLAMENHKLQLAKYLERFLDADKKQLTQSWIKAYRNPNELKNVAQYQPFGEEAKQIVLTGLKRLVRRDYQLAASLWPEFEKRFQFTQEEKADLLNYFARNMAVNYYPEAEYWLNEALTVSDDGNLLHYGIRHALREHDWQRAKQWLAVLDQSERGSAQWRYWESQANRAISEYKAILLKEPGIAPTTATPAEFDVMSLHTDFVDGLQHTDRFRNIIPASLNAILEPTEAPVHMLEGLAGERSFYGFIASQKLKRPLELNNNNSKLSDVELEKVATHPGIVRARELYLIGEPIDARREWYHAIKSMTSEERGYAAHLANIWGWHHQAIMAAARSDDRDNLDLRFPRAYPDIVSAKSQQHGVESEWVYSLIRQESAFAPSARSPAGALGMMQLMPSTAKQVSRKLGLNFNTHNLLDPENNITLGTQYLSDLLQRFEGNIVLATAAYNAGPHRAKRWQPDSSPMEGDIWIETIPIHETREYVKNILTYQAIYRHHLGMEPKLANSLWQIQPKQVSSVAQTNKK